MSAVNNRRIAALASDRAVHRAFAWLHLHEARMRRWQMEFLGIPAPPFGEAERAAWFCERFREMGLADARVDAAGNAVAELGAEGAGDNGPVVMLSAHLDTVFPVGTDCVPREEEAKILGPGACDNGAGLTALLGLAAALKHAAIVPGCTILFAANVGEEGEGDLRGMRHLFAEAPYAGRVRAAIALEGGGDAMVVDRALGSRRLRVTIAGPGGHSWADAGRANPIMTLAAALVELGRLRLPTRPRTTLNCGVVRGGTSVNSIPELATADLDLRSVSGIELDRVELGLLETLTRIVDAENQRRGEAALKLHVERIGNRAAGALAASSGLAMSLKAVDRHLGIATEARIGSTDANLPLSLGVPALAIGAGGVGWGIHTLQEGYDPTGRDLALRRVLLLLLDICAMTAESDKVPVALNAGINFGS
ncbi:M20/M25/M40 family metallo-hydrolase [Granulicella sp. L46]|uniref:M20/M25/M40 family metallo-hydrolase n=1 Tax=Granulicella sp. L46 TaxID=1641865 RepID=UPI00131C42AC|nr:M20/M25/M40 family metallo-hydrolase [Granulicella sp. L46]